MIVLETFVFALFALIGGVYAKFVWKRRRLYELADQIPGPKGLPLLGMAHKFLTGDSNMFLKVSQSFYGLKKFWIGPELFVLVDTPEGIQTVLNSQKCINKSPLYDLMPMNRGLGIVGGDVWKRHRRLLDPSFHLEVIKKMIPIFNDKTSCLVESLKKEVGTCFDFQKYAMPCTLETLSLAIMDTDRDYQSDPLSNEYGYHVEIAGATYVKKMYNFLYHFEPLYKFTKSYQMEKKHVFDYVFKFGEEIFNEKKHLLNKNSKQQLNDEEIGTRKSKNFINTLIDPNNGYDEAEMTQEINTFMIAGFETSALVSSNCLLMIAMHPEVQDLVVKELKDVFGSTKSEIDYESLEKLIYLDMVVKETLRYLTPVPMVLRKSTDEFDIGEYTIPRGTTIGIYAFSLHRDKLYWGKDADEFKPERFEPERMKDVHPYAFIPFAGGPRICIAKRFGLLFIKSVLANVLRNYEVSTSLKFDEIEVKISMSLRVVQKCFISLKQRNLNF